MVLSQRRNKTIGILHFTYGKFVMQRQGLEDWNGGTHRAQDSLECWAGLSALGFEQLKLKASRAAARVQSLREHDTQE